MIFNLSLSIENIHYVLNNSIKGQYMPDNVLGIRIAPKIIASFFIDMRQQPIFQKNKSCVSSLKAVQLLQTVKQMSHLEHEGHVILVRQRNR